MRRRSFLSLAAAPGVLAPALSGAVVTHPPREVHPGVWKFTLGAPERITPVSTRHYQPAVDGLRKLPSAKTCPVAPVGAQSKRGYLVRLPLASGEIVYGLGLQLQSFIQRGLKKKLRVNADPRIDSGDSHAPVPFYVTTQGYGVLVDTARYATFYCGSTRRVGEPPSSAGSANPAGPAGDNLPAAYRDRGMGEKGEVLVAEQPLRRDEQSPGEGQPLLLAGREFLGPVPLLVEAAGQAAQAAVGQGGGDACFAVGFRGIGIGHRGGQVAMGR